MGLHQTKTFRTAKESITTAKRQPLEKEKVLADHVSNKGLTSKICKELIKPKSRKTKNSIKKWAEVLNGHFPKKALDGLLRIWSPARVTREVRMIQCVIREVRMIQRVTREVRMTHIQTAMRCHYRSLWPEPQKSRAEQTAGVAGLWRSRKLPQLRQECELVRSLWRTVWRVLEMLTHSDPRTQQLHCPVFI